MQITFASEHLCAIACSAFELDRLYGPQFGAKIRQRLAELDAVDSVIKLSQLPYVNIHFADGIYSLSVSTTSLIRFRIVETNSATSFSSSQEQAIVVLSIEGTKND